jgi:hypothetical protein
VGRGAVSHEYSPLSMSTLLKEIKNWKRIRKDTSIIKKNKIILSAFIYTEKESF